jgi:hypothetical protein
MKSMKTTRSSVKADFKPVRAAQPGGRLFERKHAPGQGPRKNGTPKALEQKRKRDRDPEVRARRKKARQDERLGGDTLRDLIVDPHAAGPNNRFTAERKGQFLEWFSAGLSLRQAARKVGVAPQTVYEHVNTDPDFAEVYLRAQDVNTEMLESVLSEVAYAGHVGAILAVLKQRRPVRWRETTRTELTGKDGDPIQVEEQQNHRKELMATILAAIKGPEPAKLAAVKK